MHIKKKGDILLMTQEEVGQKRQEDISGSSLRKKDLLRLFKVAASCRPCIKVKDGISP